MRISANRIKAWLVLVPCIVVVFYFIWGFAAYTAYLSVTKSTFLPDHEFIGAANYRVLFDHHRWWVAYSNMFVFGGCTSPAALRSASASPSSSIA
ncbi:MAG: hypothetical protein OXF56_00390 [Rhodobacteraceae bacterium]|nr:hypothetical protein [Paracoccaceae bacterium]